MTDSSRPILLLVDDEAAIRTVISKIGERSGFEVLACSDGRQALDLMRTRPVDLALVDVRMPYVGGIEVLKALRRTVPHCHVILMSGSAAADTIVEAIRLGAMDYLTKPFDLQRLGQLFAEVRDAVRARAASGSPDRAEFHGLIGTSPAMADVFTLIRRLSPYARVALVTGETGTGKELVARALHQCGPRRTGKFVAINCSAVVETLFESELFGHVRGAFTGAVSDKAGLFEQAHGGTLFLDEIGELPLNMQAKLLRVLETGELLRVGALHPRTVDVRVIAATNRDLRTEVAARRFREDLLFRLNTIEIALPSLRERRSDIPALARVFAAHFAARTSTREKVLTPPVLHELSTRTWFGNVRELRNVIERACMVADGDAIGPEHLQAEISIPTVAPQGPRSTANAGPDSRAPHAAAGDAGVPLVEMERACVIRVMEATNGNKRQAAAALGLSRRAFYRRLEKHGLEHLIDRRSCHAPATTSEAAAVIEGNPAL